MIYEGYWLNVCCDIRHKGEVAGGFHSQDYSGLTKEDCYRRAHSDGWKLYPNSNRSFCGEHASEAKPELKDIQDKNFAGGLSPAEYLNKFRDGELD